MALAPWVLRYSHQMCLLAIKDNAYTSHVIHDFPRWSEENVVPAIVTAVACIKERGADPFRLIFFLSLSLSLYIYIYVCVCFYIYIYIICFFFS